MSVDLACTRRDGDVEFRSGGGGGEDFLSIFQHVRQVTRTQNATECLALTLSTSHTRSLFLVTIDSTTCVTGNLRLSDTKGRGSCRRRARTLPPHTATRCMLCSRRLLVALPKYELPPRQWQCLF